METLSRRQALLRLAAIGGGVAVSALTPVIARAGDDDPRATAGGHHHQAPVTPGDDQMLGTGPREPATVVRPDPGRNTDHHRRSPSTRDIGNGPTVNGRLEHNRGIARSGGNSWAVARNRGAGRSRGVV